MGKIEKDNFLLTGISYKTAPVEIREKFTFDSAKLAEIIKEIHSIDGISQCVALSTCNRTEIYALCNVPPEKVMGRIDKYILEKTGENTGFLESFYHLTGDNVIEHLFNVTCGIESMIVGEPQIFGQVKNAYSTACDENCTGPAINRLFHHAFQVGKSIRNQTSIGEGSVSVSSAAVKLARDLFGGFDNLSALLIGAGEIGKSCAKQFYDSGLKNFYISNRSPEKAKELAETFSSVAIPIEEIESMFDKVDIVISSVASSETVIKKASISSSMSRRKDRHLFLIDLGVPRNIDPPVSEIRNVHLFNIDDLENVTLDNQDKRRSEAEKAHAMIKSETEEYCRWLKEREAIPVIQKLRAKCESLRADELERIKNSVNPETYTAVDLVTRRLIRKLLHNPTIKMRISDRDSRERLMEAIEELFIRKSNGNAIEDNPDCHE